MEESLQNHSNILDTNSTVTGVTIDPDRLSAVCVSPSAMFTFVPMFSLHTCSFSALLFALCAKIVTCFHVFWKLDNAFTYGPNFQVVSRFTVWIKQQTLWQTVSREEGVTLETALHTHTCSCRLVQLTHQGSLGCCYLLFLIHHVTSHDFKMFLSLQRVCWWVPYRVRLYLHVCLEHFCSAKEICVIAGVRLNNESLYVTWQANLINQQLQY